jgi:hypothetical protein
MQYLFMMGNKRSGTSHLVRLLNAHPHLFLSHESDVVWLLRLASLGEPPRGYPWDGRIGMDATLAAAGHILEDARPRLARGQGVAETFERMQLHLMRNGSEVQAAYEKPDVEWLGDKKPVQHADPEVFPFIRTHFSHARYLHIVRHPRAVVASMARRAQEGAPVEFWSRPLDHLLDRWCLHEEWVQAAAAKLGDALLTVRYEDLVADAERQVGKIFDFLDLDLSKSIAQRVASATKAGTNAKSESLNLPRSRRADELMARYSYEP